MGQDGSHFDFDRDVAAEIPALLRFATRLTGDPDRGQEVAQEALLRAARGKDSFRGDARLRTWLLQIAIHAFRDQLARRRLPTEPLLADPVDLRQSSPETASLEDELRRNVARHVSGLPARQREVLVLTVYEELPIGDVAKLLGITVASVHVNLHHARKRLKTLLADYLAEK